MAQSSTCNAIVQQGPRKNQLCTRTVSANGYCIYHQRNAEYDHAIQAGRSLCAMFFRGCNNDLSTQDIANQLKNCESCRLKKSGKSANCQVSGCPAKIEKEEDKYCKKHIRQHLRDNEEKEQITYCDIARGCFNRITNGTKCNECYQKERAAIAVDIHRLRITHGIYDIVPFPPDNMTSVHLRQEDALITVAELWRCVQKNAYSRGLMFTLTEQEFERIIVLPCRYCERFSSARLNGIDRMDNNKGYLPSNCVPCCTVCNIIKNVQHPVEFLDKVDAIYSYLTEGSPIAQEKIELWSATYKSHKQRDSYSTCTYYANRRNIIFQLTENEYTNLIQGTCYLCGIPNMNGHTNGIDRYDSSIRAYTVENSRTCCGHCNQMKGVLSYDEFVEKCTQIHHAKVDRTLFEAITPYGFTKSRKEQYTAEEVANMMQTGVLAPYIEWCKEHERSPEYISALLDLQRTSSLPMQQELIDTIRAEMDHERSRKARNDEPNDRKMMNCKSVYSYLSQGKKDDFVQWFMNHYTKTSMFDTELDRLVEQLPSLDREKGIEACKTFMYAEKNRRVTQNRRAGAQKVSTYTPPAIVCITTTTMDNTPKNEIIMPVLSADASLEQQIQHVQEQVGYQKKDIEELKQWKTADILSAFRTNQEHHYKTHCESNNDMSNHSNWETEWNTFADAVRTCTTDPTQIIQAFIEHLRRIRHNALILAKNRNPIERDTRQQWPATTVVRAFQEGKLDCFKAFTETYSGESPTDPKWAARWDLFVISLKQHQSDPQTMQQLCSKFMTAQRTKKYRRNKISHENG